MGICYFLIYFRFISLVFFGMFWFRFIVVVIGRFFLLCSRFFWNVSLVCTVVFWCLVSSRLWILVFVIRRVWTRIIVLNVIR